MKSVVVSILTFLICYGCCLVALLSIVGVIADDAKSLKPIVLVPGYHVNRLEAKLDRQEVKYEYCELRTDDYFDLWLTADDYKADLVNCFVDNMLLRYDEVTRTTSNQEGVSIRVHFNKTEPLEYSSSDENLEGSPQFNTLVERLVDLGYKRNENLLGAAYDFRRTPNELTEYLANLEQLIERAYSNNGCKPVVIICHSMGCSNSLYFLHSQVGVWKSKYIDSLISLSGSYGGASSILVQYIAGVNYKIPTQPDLKRTDILTWPSTAYRLPSAKVFPDDQVLVKDIKNEFTSNDYKELFDKIQNSVGYEQYLDTKDLVDITEPPGVKAHCMHGYGIQTPEQIVYSTKEIGKYFNSNETIINGDGDGIVNLQSLKVCLDWNSKQSEPAYYKNFSSVTHLNMLNDENVFQYIKEALEIS